MALKPVSVTQLNDYISRVLMTDPLLANIRVSGEISNIKYHQSGHVYFSINDEQSKINCFFPASYVRNLQYELGDGLEVIINGYINVYKKGGTYTLFVKSIEIEGKGNLQAAFNLLKEKLEKEGLFDKSHKKPIPGFPKRVGVVTSETGAALQDILKIIKSRSDIVDIIIFPTTVQGDGAAEDIADSIALANRDYTDIDVLLVGRGGGSQEDLWAFNEEVVARAIFESEIPIISCVGHETDFTIADFTADLRAETPTAAAEIAVPDVSELRDRVNSLKKHLDTDLDSKLRFELLRIDNLLLNIRNQIERKITDYEYLTEKLKLYLDENNPYSLLSKGYSVLTDSNGSTVKSLNDVRYEDRYVLKLYDGKVSFRFSDIVKDYDTEESKDEI